MYICNPKILKLCYVFYNMGLSGAVLAHPQFLNTDLIKIYSPYHQAFHRIFNSHPSSSAFFLHSITSAYPFITLI